MGVCYVGIIVRYPGLKYKSGSGFAEFSGFAGLGPSLMARVCLDESLTRVHVRLRRFFGFARWPGCEFAGGCRAGRDDWGIFMNFFHKNTRLVRSKAC